MSGCAVQPQVTSRILDLLQVAADALAQAAYEGDHNARLDPAPREGTPWNTPDLPAPLAEYLATIRADLDSLSALAVEDAAR